MWCLQWILSKVGGSQVSNTMIQATPSIISNITTTMPKARLVSSNAIDERLVSKVELLALGVKGTVTGFCSSKWLEQLSLTNARPLLELLVKNRKFLLCAFDWVAVSRFYLWRGYSVTYKCESGHCNLFNALFEVGDARVKNLNLC